MKKSICKTAILTFGVVITLIAGCGEQEVSKSEIKRGRLIAAENRRLKKEIDKLNKQLEKCLKEEKAAKDSGRLQAKIKQLEEQVEELKELKGITELEEEMQKNVDAMLEGTIKNVDEIKKLNEENEKLRAEIIKLKKELEVRNGPAPISTE